MSTDRTLSSEQSDRRIIGSHDLDRGAIYPHRPDFDVAQPTNTAVDRADVYLPAKWTWGSAKPSGYWQSKS